MNNDLIFQIVNGFAFLGWIPLFAAPFWKYTLFVSRVMVVLPLALFYTVLIFSGVSDLDPNSFSSLEGVKALFSSDTAIVAGWIHYLAFDLFVGTYIVQRGVQLNLPRWLFTLCLPFTFMFGPLGLFLFSIILFARKSKPWEMKH
jgi:hypothetical protein